MAKQITLIPLDDATNTIRTFSPGTIVKIGRCEGNLIKISDRRVARNHCEIWFDGTSWVVANLSRANCIKVNNQILKGFMKKKLKQNCVLFLSKQTKRLGFEVQFTEETSQKSNLGSSSTSIEMQSMMVERSFEEKLLENLQCPLCLNIFCEPVIALRCCHTFCGGCLSQWFKSQNNYNCPCCRKIIKQTSPDRKIEEIARKYLEEYPCRKRDRNEMASLSSANVLQQEFQTYRPIRQSVAQGIPILMQPGVFNGYCTNSSQALSITSRLLMVAVQK